MGMDIMQGCGSAPGTIGNLSHLAGFVAGASYVLLAEPLLGGRAVPRVPCKEADYFDIHVWKKRECFAFFTPDSSYQVSTVQTIAQVVLLVGVVAALFNAFWINRSVHPSADGYSIFCRPPPEARDAQAQDVEVAMAEANSRLTAAMEANSRLSADAAGDQGAQHRTMMVVPLSREYNAASK
jgi:hypothetical protein